MVKALASGAGDCKVGSEGTLIILLHQLTMSQLRRAH